MPATHADRPLPGHGAGNRAPRAAPGDGDDPAPVPFLGFLARDLAEHPERLQAVDAGLAQRIRALVGGVEVNLDAPLSADDE